MIKSNVVPKAKFRERQLEALQLASDVVECSFGPRASNTCITAQGKATEFSKDGKTILQNIKVFGLIEQSVIDELVSLVNSVVGKIGDGTTSAVILSNIIFNYLGKVEEKFVDKTPYDIIFDFKKVADMIVKEIETRAQEFTAQTAYDITYISTNGNEQMAQYMKDIYEKFGNDVFIDVTISTNENNMIKEYDGMNLNVGLAEPALANTPKNTSYIREPRIYAFVDPVDTQEQVQFFDKIVSNNITDKLNAGQEPIPTVILSPRLSRDMSSYMDKITNYCLRQDVSQRPPLLIITNITEEAKFYDLTKLCGCKPIKKYIDPKLQEEDIKSGIAPTVDNICDEFYGMAEVVEADSTRTKFINPAEMYDENGEPSANYKALVDWLQGEIARAVEEGATATTIGTLKRRLQSLNCNLVEFLIGGVSVGDRDALRALVEDAVLNCRSAAQNGYGYASNFEGFRASMTIAKELHETELGYIANMIYKAYQDIIKKLYQVSGVTDVTIQDLIIADRPYDVKKREFSDKVISSIKGDIAVIDTISKLLTVMFTSNQFICADIALNQY